MFYVISNRLIQLWNNFFSVFASLTFFGTYFQKGVTLFRKKSFLGVHKFAGSLRKHIHSFLKFPAAGPFLSLWTIFFWDLSSIWCGQDHTRFCPTFFTNFLMTLISTFLAFTYIPPFICLAQALSL